MKINISKLCSWIVILFMPLSLYGTYIEKITVGDISLILGIIIAIYLIATKKINIREIIANEILIYIVLIIMNSLVQFFFDAKGIKDGIFSLLRYLMFMFFVMIIPKHFLEKEYTYKIYEKIGIIFAIYSLIQFFCFYAFKYILPINILPLKTSTDLSIIQNISRYSNGRVLFRPYSVFIEPSYFSIFESYLLYWLLNCKKHNNKDNIKIITLTLAMIISGTTGIVMIAICFFRKICALARKNVLKTITLLTAIIVVIITFYNTNYGKKVINRVFVNGEFGSSIDGRIGNLQTILQEVENGKTLLVGNGIWIEHEYLPSIGRLIISLGLLGSIIYLCIMLKMFKVTNDIGKKYIILFLVSFIATNSLFNITSVLVYCLIIMNYKKGGNSNEKDRTCNLV